MKTLFFVCCLAGTSLCFTACSPAYVAERPTYREYTRPVRTNNTHIWMDDDWKWNRRSHAYVQQDGYWRAPNQGQTYNQGHWISNKRGHRWVKGQWR